MRAIKPLNMYGLNADRTLTGRINCSGDDNSHLPFDSGWQPPMPAAATPLGHGGTSIPLVIGLDSAAEARVVAQIVATPDTSERSALFVEWDDLNRRLREYLTNARARRIEVLQAELEIVKTKGREALKKWRAAEQEARLAQGHLSSYQEILLNTRARLRVAESERPDPDEWPTEDELAAYEETLGKARQEVEVVDQRYTKLGEAAQHAQGAANAAFRVLDALRDQRDNLKAKLEGRPHRGPHGLVVPGGII